MSNADGVVASRCWGRRVDLEMTRDRAELDKAINRYLWNTSGESTRPTIIPKLTSIKRSIGRLGKLFARMRVPSQTSDTLYQR